MRENILLKTVSIVMIVAVFAFYGVINSYAIVGEKSDNSIEQIQNTEQSYLIAEDEEDSEIFDDSDDSNQYIDDDSVSSQSIANNQSIEGEKFALKDSETISGTDDEYSKNRYNKSEIMEEEFSHTINMVTGSKTGTYFRFGNDIKQILTPDGIDIVVENSKGSIENINKIGSGKAVLGIVQSDVLGFLRRSNQPESRKLAEKLRMVFPFYQEEVHLIANKTVSKFSDLNGKIIAVGPKGSGSWLTAVNLFKLTGVHPSKMLRLSPEKGLVAVLTNKADAMIFVAGKPVKLFKNLDSLADQEQYSYMLDNVHMISITDEKILKEYSASVLTSEDYKFVESPVATIAVTAALISYDYSSESSAYKRSRCNDIKEFSSAMYSKIDEIRASGHPKWKEVDLTAEVGLWSRDKCAKVSSISSTLEEEMLKTLDLNW